MPGLAPQLEVARLYPHLLVPDQLVDYQKFSLKTRLKEPFSRRARTPSARAAGFAATQAKAALTNTVHSQVRPRHGIITFWCVMAQGPCAPSGHRRAGGGEWRGPVAVGAGKGEEVPPPSREERTRHQPHRGMITPGCLTSSRVWRPRVGGHSS
jgi:hypothetical protein